jgi:hypothetical protein
MTMLSVSRNIFLGVVTSIAALVCMVLLPHDRFIRFQDMRVEAYARLGWIYERIHFDPTPIDVAFIGTSHTLTGVDAAAAAHVIEEIGKQSNSGVRSAHLTNLAFPNYGRNMHWIIARELLENRQVGMLVLEIFENETRKPHPLFVYPAEVSDIIDAPLLVNLNYFHDMARLPFRQLSLFIKTLWPEQFGLKQRFDPAHYGGETVDNTRLVQINGQAITSIRNKRMEPDALVSAASQRRSGKNLHMMGRNLEELEYRFPRYYVSKILALADRKHVPVIFLYLPAYGQVDYPFDTKLYDGKGKIITVNDILRKTENWADLDHLNLFGAAELSARLGAVLAHDVLNLTVGAESDPGSPHTGVKIGTGG